MNPWLHTGRGFSFYKAGDTPEAIRSFDRAIANDPSNANAYIHRSWAYRKLGDAPRSEADRRKGLSLDPSSAGQDVMFP